MATNYYGSCTGASGKKYDLWLNVTQNFQDIVNNKSNVTVNFYLKRNDGYSGSAYNLNDNVNTVKLVVGSSTKVSKYIKIDTRNNAKVLLASWTGNVSHSADGTLSLSVSGVFTLDGVASLTGGSASGTFKCTTIPRKSSASFSVTTVNPGTQMSVTLTSASEVFSHKIIWSLGTKNSSVVLEKNVLTTSFTVPVSWAEELTGSTTGNLVVTVTTYKGTTSLGSQKYNIKLLIPATDEYKPEFSLKLVRVDNTVPSEWNEYVKGISGITVSAENILYKYGAEFSSVNVTVGSLSKASLPATFEIKDSGDVKVSVSLKDSRGLVSTVTETINVLDYNPPSIDVKSIRRCDANGVVDPYGTYLIADYIVNYSPLNSKNTYAVSAKYRTSDSDLYSGEIALSESPAIFGDGAISIGSSYSVSVMITDTLTIQSPEIIRHISSGNIPFNIKRGGNGAAFGKFSEKENELSVAWNLAVDGNISGTFNGMMHYDTPGCEILNSVGALVSDIRHYPGFNLTYVKLRLTVTESFPANTKTYVAKISDEVPSHFTPLECFANGDDNILCKGGIFSATGEIFIEPNKEIPVGRFIYFNGFYISDYQNNLQG